MQLIFTASSFYRCLAVTKYLTGIALFLLALPALAQSNPIAVEKIFVSEFEEQPVEIFPRIEFVGDRTQIFSASGETRTAEVRVFDASGNVITDPAIDWSSSNSALLSVSAGAPGEAQLESTGTWTGSLTYEATYAPLGITV